METKEFKVSIPEGYEIDNENSTFECIKFKPIIKRFRDDLHALVYGYFLHHTGNIEKTQLYVNRDSGWSYATEKQAKSALAMAKLSQIIAHDKRFGGPITDEEWCGPNNYYSILRYGNTLYVCFRGSYDFLAFHTEKQANLFLEENKDLIR